MRFVKMWYSLLISYKKRMKIQQYELDMDFFVNLFLFTAAILHVNAAKKWVRY